MAETFENLWKKLLVYAPDCPLPLVQEFVNTAYSRALAAGSWWGLRGYGTYSIGDQASLAVTATKNSAVLNCLGATTNHPGLQLFYNSGPLYTIQSSSAGLTLTLDHPWAAASGAYTVTVQGLFLVAPTDFLHFISVVDNENNWRLRTDYLQEDIDNWDSKRTSTGTAWMIVPTTPSPVSATLGLPRYEPWPRPTSAKNYTFTYTKKPALMSAASDTPIFPIRGDTLKHGAFAELSLWPGTLERKNPYFDLNLARTFEERFQLALISTRKEDQEIAQTAVKYAEEDVPFMPMDAQFIQEHI